MNECKLQEIGWEMRWRVRQTVIFTANAGALQQACNLKGLLLTIFNAQEQNTLSWRVIDRELRPRLEDKQKGKQFAEPTLLPFHFSQ